MDTVKSILRGQTVITVDTTNTNYDVLVETIPSNPEEFADTSTNLKMPGVLRTSSKTNTFYLLKTFSDVLTSGKAGFTLKCSIHKTIRNNQSFVHILPADWALYSAFTYIPTFQIVCIVKNELSANDHDRVGLTMSLVSFNGKVLSHHSEILTFAGVTNGQEVKEASMIAACAGSRLLKLFSDGQFELCQGVTNCNKIWNTLKSYGLQSGMCRLVNVPSLFL